MSNSFTRRATAWVTVAAVCLTFALAGTLTGQPPGTQAQTLPATNRADQPDSEPASSLNASIEAIRPFPLNRVRGFYFQQAETLLDAAEIPSLLPQFPGLDGGGFGHWGQNPEEVNFDHTLNLVDTGNIVCQVIHHFGQTTVKGVAVRIDPSGPTTVVFDPQRLTFVDCWRDGFVKWGVSRFGVMGGVQASGQRVRDFSGSRWDLPPGQPFKYRGFHRRGTKVIFEYTIGTARVLDRMTLQEPHTIRTLQIDGPLPAGVKLRLLSGTLPAESRADSHGVHVRNSEASGTIVTPLQLPANCRLVAADQDAVLELPASPMRASVQLAFHSSDAAAAQPVPVDPRNVDLRTQIDPASSDSLPQGQWVNQTVVTRGQLDQQDRAFAIDTLTIPFEQLNPFGTPMRLAGVGCLSDGRIVVSTIMGDVWLVTPLDEKLARIRWQRIAAGLYQPLGLVIHNDQIVVLGRDQITRLHDRNGDSEADFYECVTHDYPTTDGHDFCTSLQQDAQHNLYWFTAARNFGVTRLSNPFTPGPVQSPVSLGTGLRNSNGIGVSPDGQIVLATVQEGTWTPASAIFEVRNNSYHGLNGPIEGHGSYGYDLPVCFLPRGVDNSSGELIFLPEDARLGPLAGQIVGTSFGDCSHYLVLRELVNGRSQGGIMPLEGEFQSGACRLAFNSKDGCLYVAGTEGWQSYAAENGCLHRVRFTGKPVSLPTAIETHSNGILLRFSQPVHPDSVHLKNVFSQQWNYLYSSAYGSPEYSIAEPGRQAHDYVPVQSVHLLGDERSIFVEIPQLHPVMQFHLHLRLKTASGTDFTPDLYTSIFDLQPDFTDFPGYQPYTKLRAPEFPRPEKLAIDPRLAKQDQLGTNFGWVQQATKLSINALPGLQYSPVQLRVAPGEKVALTFHNTDSSMPHNIAVVPGDVADAFAEKAMMLASNPRAIATHYVPQDSGEICFSPILNPEDQYTVFFEAPTQTGEYKFLCTYPGHARVMRGSLFVLADGDPLPEMAAEETRRFVKQWSVEDLSTDASHLQNRSFERGRSVFRQAGCVKCHRMQQEGSALGPDLTRIHERFRGAQLLQHVLDPSLEINKQYQSWMAVTQQGQAITGLMVHQDDHSITLLPNPLKPESQVTLKREELEELAASRLSTMPAGLLMVFEREEILDLLAFIQAGGEPQHAIFAK